MSKPASRPKLTQQQMARLAGAPRLPYEVLLAIHIQGGKATFAEILAHLPIAKGRLKAAIQHLNARGYVAGRPTARGKARLMHFAITVLGDEILTAFNSGIVRTLRLGCKYSGLDRVPEFRRREPWLFLHDPEE